MKLYDLLGVISSADRIRIIEGEYKTRDPERHPENKIIHTGYNCFYDHDEIMLILKEKDPQVKRLVVTNEIRHREYKERGLFPPFEPELTRQYEFKDLTMFQYYDIYI